MSILQFKKVNCKNCYKCVRFCPVKAIEVKNHCAQIIEDDCILCGTCTIVCPQSAKEDKSDIPAIAELLRAGRQVIASIAPSFSAYFNSSFSDIRDALLKLTFSDVFETAEGAFLVKSEYEKLISENPEKTYISSCCSSVNTYIRKYHPEAIPYLAPVLTPMQAHARLIRSRFPDAAIVFIGPCISKKAERLEAASEVDYIATFDEMKDFFLTSDITLPVYDGSQGGVRYLSRMFPVSGGILDTLEKAGEHRYIAIDGFDNCVQTINDVSKGTLKNCFIEMSMCEGSCIGGPSFRKGNYSLLSSELKVVEGACADNHTDDFNTTGKPVLAASFLSQKIIRMSPTEAQIAGILSKMGKNTIEDELNCSMCGYPSCREKAIAVFLGKAEINMCLPYMKERAESFSEKIINITPNAILTVDMNLKVQQINQSACMIFGLLPEDIVNQPVSRILDEFDFVSLITSDTARSSKYNYLADYKVYLEQTFLYDRNNSIIICIMKDITQARQKKNTAMQSKMQAAAMADDIADRQLRVVHEIAALLGETAAETKIAIHDLKETILLDDRE